MRRQLSAVLAIVPPRVPPLVPVMLLVMLGMVVTVVQEVLAAREIAVPARTTPAAPETREITETTTAVLVLVLAQQSNPASADATGRWLSSSSFCSLA